MENGCPIWHSCGMTVISEFDIGAREPQMANSANTSRLADWSLPGYAPLMITVETTETDVRVTIPKGEVPADRLNSFLDWLRLEVVARRSALKTSRGLRLGSRALKRRAEQRGSAP